MSAVRVEVMSDIFTKFHIASPGVVHRFTAPDTGAPHDHPWAFTSTILHGGYVEQVFQLDGSSEFVERKPGDEFDIAATHIHRITDLPNGECWTFIEPRPPFGRKSGFWEWHDGEARFTPWDAR